MVMKRTSKILWLPCDFKEYYSRMPIKLDPNRLDQGSDLEIIKAVEFQV